jgi:D-alanyl-D-alanine carboxypeptidase/D-alanyl-D-alanine-endopeptidase (penicillin-binding protein 4)
MKPLLIIFISIALFGCNASKQIAKSAKKDVLDESVLKTAHVGISIFEPATNRYWYNYQGDHYFTPASNTKIPTCYAAMKYLGDSIPGLKYRDTDSVIFIRPTADPTLLHREISSQRVFEFLKGVQRKIAYVMPRWEAEIYGQGWSWDDYNANYMPERSELPIYGNVLQLRLQQSGNKYDLKSDIYFFRYAVNSYVMPMSPGIRIRRRRCDNTFDVFESNDNFSEAEIPFRTWENERLLEDTLKKAWLNDVYPPDTLSYRTIYSLPTDTLLKITMHKSDNLFAEQSLLMVSDKFLGVMNDEKIIDTLLQTDFKELPQKPRWADGSGLSRYNLFTPQDLVFILNKMKNDFGMERIKNILPTGSEGTLSNYYLQEKGYIFAKTGSLSGVVTISGFLYTKKNKLLIFSVLVNNHSGSATEIRRAVEKFIEGVRNNY